MNRPLYIKQAVYIAGYAVEIEFSDLNEEEISTFQKYVTSSNTLKVRKIAIKGEGFSYHGYLQEPNEDWLREENISNYTTHEAAQKLPLYEYLPDSGRITKDIFRQAQSEYIKNHWESISFEYKLESSNFLGAKNVVIYFSFLLLKGHQMNFLQKGIQSLVNFTQG